MPKIILDIYNDNRILAELHKAIGIFLSTCNPHNRMYFADVSSPGKTAQEIYLIHKVLLVDVSPDSPPRLSQSPFYQAIYHPSRPSTRRPAISLASGQLRPSRR
jgi:hypothetical protein